MTVAPDVAQPGFDDLADAERLLRKRGLRLSTSRRLVLRALFAADGHASAEHFARSLQIELTSVYRNLETLERNGLVRHVHLGHGPGLYVLVGHGEREYLYCERCGAVRALDPRQLEPVRSQLKKRFGYQARFAHFAIVGTCAQCAKRARCTAASLGEAMTEQHDEHDHQHEHPHSHVHEHLDATVHEHEHSHGDYAHSHPHVHQKGLEDQHHHGH